MSKALDLTSYYEAKAAKKEREPDLSFHVVVVGDKQVGKSAIVQQLCFNKWRDLEKEALERAKRDGGKGKKKNQPSLSRYDYIRLQPGTEPTVIHRAVFQMFASAYLLPSSSALLQSSRVGVVSLRPSG